MLTIRRQQVAALGEALWESFTERLIHDLREHYPQWTKPLTDEALDARVRREVARARARGLEWESSVAHFVKLSFLLGPGFADHPRVAGALAGGDGSPDQRLERLMRTTSGADWRAIAAAGRAG